MRLVLTFAALLLPPLALYPMAASTADRTARALVEHEYAPATARHPQDLQAQLIRVEQEIDKLGSDFRGGIGEVATAFCGAER